MLVVDLFHWSGLNHASFRMKGGRAIGPLVVASRFFGGAVCGVKRRQAVRTTPIDSVGVTAAFVGEGTICSFLDPRVMPGGDNAIRYI